MTECSLNWRMLKVRLIGGPGGWRQVLQGGAACSRCDAARVAMRAVDLFAPALCCVQYIFTHCHVYDKDQNYLPFDADKPEMLFEVQRKVLPETM